MIEQLTIYKNLIGGSIAAIAMLILYIYIHSLNGSIAKLQSSLKDCQVAKANQQLQSERYKNELDKQNDKIAQLEAQEALNLAKLKKWKEQPPKVRYKTITKIREVHSDKCKDVKDTLDAIKHIDPDSL